MARHDARVEDLLETPRPLIRMTLLPWTVPLARRRSIEGRLEIGLERGEVTCVAIDSWLGEAPIHEVDGARIPIEKLTAPWLESRLIAFVRRVLAGA